MSGTTDMQKTEDGEIVVSDFLEYNFSLFSRCGGYYFYWY